jgi:hypothetical protein
MPRRLSRAMLALALVSLLAACGGQSAPALTDPTEILTKSIETMQEAKSVRVDVTLSGTITADPTGTGGLGSTFPLDGTTASADIDIAGGNARATFSVPAFLGLAGELIAVGGDAFVKTTLTGPLYQRMSSADGELPIDPSDVDGLDLEELRTLLAKPELSPTKGDDVACGSKDCYTVVIDLSSAEIAALGGGDVGDLDLPIDVGNVGLNMVFQVEKDTLRLAGVAMVVAMGADGSLRLDVTLSRWDEAVSISPPPADQVQP